MDGTGGALGDQGAALPSAPDVSPFDITAPQPVVRASDAVPLAPPHHHEGSPGPAVSPPGDHSAGPPAGQGRRRLLLSVAAVTAGVLVVGTVGAMALSRAGSATPSLETASPTGPAGASLTPAAGPPADATATSTPPPLPPAQDTLVLGDSLGLVVYPWLADLLPDRYVSYQAEVGRSTPATRKKLEQLSAVPPVVIVSSGTNDPVANVFEESARRILDDLGSARCVVWADIVRPDRVGDSQVAMNAALERAAAGRSNVRILHWTSMLEQHPEWLSGDGIHPNEAGSQARAQAFADAALGCSALDPSAPRAKRQYLPASAFWGPVSGEYRPPTSSRGTGSSTTTSSRSGSSSTSGSLTPTGSSSPAPAPPTSQSSAGSPSSPAETSSAPAPPPTSETPSPS